MSNMSDTLRSDDLRKAQVTSLVSGHPSSNAQYPFYLSENFPKDIVNVIESFQSPAEDLRRRMTEPASVYKPDSKFAIALNIDPWNGSQIDIPCKFLNSPYLKDVAVLPPINVYPLTPERISAQAIHMLLSLPKGRVEQIDTLFVQFILHEKNHTLDYIKGGVTIALEQINFVLKRITRLIVIANSDWVQKLKNERDVAPLEFEFDFSKANDKCLASISALTWFPLDCSDISHLQTSMEGLNHEFPQCVVKSALVGIGRFGKHISHHMSCLANVRWMIRSLPSNFIEERMKSTDGIVARSPHVTVDLSQFPNISTLITDCKLLTSSALPKCSLVSLSCTLHWPEGLRDLFALRLPELQHLSVRGMNNLVYAGPFLFSFPKVIEWILVNFRHANIRLGNLPLVFYKLKLDYFRGNLTEVDNLRILKLCVDSFINTELLDQLSERSLHVDYDNLNRNEVRSIAIRAVFGKVQDIVCRGFGTAPMELYFLETWNEYHLQSLNLFSVGINVLPVMFPCLQTLAMVRCCVRLFENHQRGMDFCNLESLSIINTAMAGEGDYGFSFNRSFNEKAAVSHYVVASQLKNLYIDNMQNCDWLIFSSEHCPELEMIVWKYSRYKGNHKIPFDLSVSEHVNFKKLRTLSVTGRFTKLHERKRPGLSLTFPLVNVAVLHLLGDLVVPNFNALELRCQHVIISTEFVDLNFELGIVSSILRHLSPSVPTSYRLRRNVQKVMPQADILILLHDVTNDAESHGEVIVHIKNDEPQEVNVSQDSLTTASTPTRPLDDHFCGFCFYN